MSLTSRRALGITDKSFFKVLSDRILYPYLNDKGSHFIEESYLIRVEFNTGESHIWTFDDLAWWAKDRKLPNLYAEVLQIALSMERLREEMGA